MRPLTVHSWALLALLLVSEGPVLAQENSPSSKGSYIPSLGDMMVAIQLKHSKLWYAAKFNNWPLADYELGQLSANLKEAARFYPNMPASDITATDKLAVQIGESIKAKNHAQFDQSFAQMTTECNRCHEAASRPFIYIRRPGSGGLTYPSPYSNQIFSPQKR